MTYVVAEPCIDTLDRACAEECPMDFIYDGDRALYIHPDGCVACEPVCPVEAIFYEDDVPAQWFAFAADNARFFTEPLPGQASPLDSLGGAVKTGRVGADTPLVAGYPPRLLTERGSRCGSYPYAPERSAKRPPPTGRPPRCSSTNRLGAADWPPRT